MSYKDDLSNALSNHLLDQDYNSDGTNHEKFMIDHLVELVGDYAMGDVSLEDLVSSFDPIGFDIAEFLSTSEDFG